MTSASAAAAAASSSVVASAASDATDDDVPLFFNQERHGSMAIASYNVPGGSWRGKDRMRTVYVALVLCLNIGVRPPDLVVPDSYPRLECWTDPTRMQPRKAGEEISKQLQVQYERWQPKARYKALLDPTPDDVRKTCLAMRKNARNARILFHYNGHGVPRPTSNGEIWVFNKQLTQYVPVSMFDLHAWLGTPSVLVFDCARAGLLCNMFLDVVRDHGVEQQAHAAAASGLAAGSVDGMGGVAGAAAAGAGGMGGAAGSGAPGSPQQPLGGVSQSDEPEEAADDFILFGACGPKEDLPLNPQLPADVLTACLTTPIKMALRWYLQRSRLLVGVKTSMIDRIPGKLNDRRTPLGELNWVFTAITDSIAWSILPPPLFQRLFRQDLLVASLFRNFLLAERILRTANVNPVSFPKLPPCHHHPLWDAWDLAAENTLAQLPTLLQLADPSDGFRNCNFFTDQLRAFRNRLQFGDMVKKPPAQLPIVLQVLLSQSHRHTALQQLEFFLDTHPDTVGMALGVGIFPYILRLLQSPAKDLRPVLVFVWGKILAVERACVVDLVRDNNYMYFVSFVADADSEEPFRVVMALFLLAAISQQSAEGQQFLLQVNVIEHCMHLFGHFDPDVRLWAALCLAQLWRGYVAAKELAVAAQVPMRVCQLLSDPVPEVRAAAVHAIGAFFVTDPGSVLSPACVAELHNLAARLYQSTSEASVLVRSEIVLALSQLVLHYPDEFKKQCERFWLTAGGNAQSGQLVASASAATGLISGAGGADDDSSSWASSTGMQLFSVLYDLSSDPSQRVSDCAVTVLRLFPPGGPAIEVDAVREALPTSSLFDWCVQKLRRSFFKSHVDTASPEWRRRVEYNRLKRRIATGPRAAPTGTQEFAQVAILESESQSASLLQFHPYLPVLLVVDAPSSVSVWDWSAQESQPKRFSNMNPTTEYQVTRITCASIANDAVESSLLALGSNDGVVRFWRNWMPNDEEPLECVAAWHCLELLPPFDVGPGLVWTWRQHTGQLVCGGQAGAFCIWDCTTERLLQNVPTMCSQAVTALTSHPSSPDVFVAGFGDGSVRAFDSRDSGHYCVAETYEEHRTYCVNAVMLSDTKVITGELNGHVKVWDLNKPVSTSTLRAHEGGMTALAVHPSCPVIASGSQYQFIKVFDQSERLLSTIKYHDGWLGQRIGPVSCLAFHPHHMVLAAGCADSLVSVYTNDPASIKGQVGPRVLAATK